MNCDFHRVSHATKAGFRKHLEMLRPENQEDLEDSDIHRSVSTGITNRSKSKLARPQMTKLIHAKMPWNQNREFQFAKDK